MRFSVVTSCSRAGYKQYGKYFVETFHKYWPLEVPLYIISEDTLDIDKTILRQRSVHFFSLYQSSVQANDFHVTHVNNDMAHGRDKRARDPRHNRHWKTGYNFRMDAYKFSKKVFAIDIAAKHAGSGKLIWLDADTFTDKPIPLEFLERVAPNDTCLSFLDRKGYHSECSFVVYNLDWPATRKFVKDFAALYHSGDVFKLKEWHDSWVFDWLRKQNYVPVYKIPHSSPSQPFDNSELGKYMSHLKGRLKNNLEKSIRLKKATTV